MGSKHYSLPYIRICSRKERKCNKVMYWLFTIKLQIATNLRIWKKVSHRLPVCLKGGGGVSDLCCGQTDRQTRLQYFSFLCLHWGMLHSLLSLPGWRYGLPRRVRQLQWRTLNSAARIQTAVSEVRLYVVSLLRPPVLPILHPARLSRDRLGLVVLFFESLSAADIMLKCQLWLAPVKLMQFNRHMQWTTWSERWPSDSADQLSTSHNSIITRINCWTLLCHVFVIILQRLFVNQGPPWCRSTSPPCGSTSTRLS